MSNYNYTDDMDDIEIDIIAFLWRIAEQWKLILIVGLLGGILTMVGMYAKDMHAYRTEINHEITEEEVTAIEEELTEEEFDAVADAVRLKKQIDDFDDYTKESLLNRIDPYHEKSVVLLYEVKAKNDTSLQVIGQQLNEEFRSSSTWKKLAEDLGYNGDPDRLGELISTSYPGNTMTPEDGAATLVLDHGGVFRITAILPAAEDAEGSSKDQGIRTSTEQQEAGISADEMVWGDALDKAFKALVKERGLEGNISLVTRKVDEVFDQELLDRQTTANDRIKANRSTLKGLTDTFSEGQQTIYDIETEENEEDDAAGDASEEGNADIKGTHAGAEGNVNLEDEPIPPAISKKALLLGFAGGVFVYCGIVFMYILLSKRVCEENAEGVFQRYPMIRIRQRKPVQGAMGWLLHDAFVNSLKMKKVLPLQDQLQNGAAEIKVLCGQSSSRQQNDDNQREGNNKRNDERKSEVRMQMEHKSSLTFLHTDSLHELSEQYNRELLSTIKHLGVDADSVTVDVNDAVDTFAQINTLEYSFLVCELDTTKIDVVLQLQRMMEEVGVSLTGVVIYG